MISAYVVARKYLLAYASILIVVNNSIIYLHQFQLFLSYIFQKNHDKPPHTCGKQEFNNNDPKTGMEEAEEAMETDSVSETADTETEEVQENQDLNPVKG